MTTQNTAAAAAAGGEEGGFAALLADLDTLAKAMPAGGKDANDDDEDETIEAAAEDGEGDEGDDAGEGNQDQPAAKGDPFGKAFEVTLADGTKAQALDGTAMMKSLHDENVALRTRADDLQTALVSVGSLLKSLHAGQTKSDALIKSLRTDVAKLGGQGSGRRAVLTLQEKRASTAEVAPAAPTQDEIMAKALSLQTAGKLVGSDVSRVFAHTSRGFGIPAEYAHLFNA